MSECAQDVAVPDLQRRRRLQVSLVSSGRHRSETSATLPPSADGLLHPGGRHRLRRARHGDAGNRVDDGDGVAGASGSGLVEFQGRVLTLVRRGDEGRGRRVQREARRNLGGKLSRGALRRVARQ